jgi:hypothetical protein
MGELIEGDVTSMQAAIAGRYLGIADGERFAAERRSTLGVLLWLISHESAALGSIRNLATPIDHRQHRHAGAVWPAGLTPSARFLKCGR